MIVTTELRIKTILVKFLMTTSYVSLQSTSKDKKALHTQWVLPMGFYGAFPAAAVDTEVDAEDVEDQSVVGLNAMHCNSGKK